MVKRQQIKTTTVVTETGRAEVDIERGALGSKLDGLDEALRADVATRLEIIERQALLALNADEIRRGRIISALSEP
ncbi:hypothetical protein KKF91_00445 [Myxococcota bacterium]|nr:hypothetical protein [Myxococcota bacterium]MBU1429003.1 hypothetical protein [Myxococcota bacterium]MBU1896992.1 hypothetical protein [Myxococcota bacterium]